MYCLHLMSMHPGKKRNVLTNPKMPEENYINDANNALLRLQLRKSRRVIKELKSYFEDASSAEMETEEYQINMKVMQVLIQQRNELANKLGMVTL